MWPPQQLQACYALSANRGARNNRRIGARSMSALGQKQTSDWRPLMSALPPRADIARHCWDVRFVPISNVPGSGVLTGPLSVPLAGWRTAWLLLSLRWDSPTMSMRPTLGELQRATPWVWLWCERCHHHAPLACAVAVIRWGPDAPSDKLRTYKFP